MAIDLAPRYVAAPQEVAVGEVSVKPEAANRFIHELKGFLMTMLMNSKTRDSTFEVGGLKLRKRGAVSRSLGVHALGFGEIMNVSVCRTEDAVRVNGENLRIRYVRGYLLCKRWRMLGKNETRLGISEDRFIALLYEEKKPGL